jgi:hypothetical protein
MHKISKNVLETYRSVTLLQYFTNGLVFKEGPEGVKWELGFAHFWVRE